MNIKFRKVNKFNLFTKISEAKKKLVWVFLEYMFIFLLEFREVKPEDEKRKKKSSFISSS